MRKWFVDVVADADRCVMRLREDHDDPATHDRWVLVAYKGSTSPVWMWFRPMERRIALAVKWAIAKVREIERDDITQADAEAMAARWTKAAQAMFAQGMKERGK